MKFLKYLMICFVFYCLSINASAATLNDLTTQLNNETKEIENLNNKITIKTEELLGLEANIKSSELNLKKQYADMKLRIQYMYENGNPSYLESFLTNNNFSELVNDISYKSEIVKYDRDKLEKIQETLNDIKEKQDKINEEKKSLEKLKTENENKKTELEKIIKEKKEEITKAEENKKQKNVIQSSVKHANDVMNSNTEITYQTANNYGYSDQQIDLICAIVAQESCSDYNGSLAVITCAMNRCDSPKWKYNGTDPLSQLCARGQFCYSIDGYHRKRLNGNYPSFVKDAVMDCLNGKRNHKFLCFRGYPGNGSTTCIGGNWYFSSL